VWRHGPHEVAMKSSTVTRRTSERWGKALGRLRPGEQRDFQFLAPLAETDSAGDDRLPKRLAALKQKDGTLR
jgi:hypothetical protein